MMMGSFNTFINGLTWYVFGESFMHNVFSYTIWIGNIEIASCRRINQVDQQQHQAKVVDKSDGVKKVGIATASV